MSTKKKGTNAALKRVALPVLRTAPIHDAARILDTTVQDLRAKVARGEAVGVRNRHGESVEIVLQPGAQVPELVAGPSTSVPAVVVTG